MNRSLAPAISELGRRLDSEVLTPLKSAFIQKDEIIDLLGICLIAGENLFLLGPPGTAKTAIVHHMSRKLQGRPFDYLLTRFTEPSEIFGPFDIRKLREGELTTNTEGMLPEADMVFLDELLNANSALLNSLLMALNERIFRRGRETRPLRALMFTGASNRLPEDDTLRALFDRFLLRVRCDNVAEERLPEVLEAGWLLDRAAPEPGRLGFDDIRALQAFLCEVDLSAVRPPFVELIQRIRRAGIPVSDRRAVKMQRLLAASALLCGRLEARWSDVWMLKHIWEAEEQQEVLEEIIRQAIAKTEPDPGDHPRAHAAESPDPESLARDLDAIAARLDSRESNPADLAYLRDRLSVLAARVQWVNEPEPRGQLEARLAALWQRFPDQASTP